MKASKCTRTIIEILLLDSRKGAWNLFFKVDLAIGRVSCSFPKDKSIPLEKKDCENSLLGRLSTTEALINILHVYYSIKELHEQSTS